MAVRIAQMPAPCSVVDHCYHMPTTFFLGSSEPLCSIFCCFRSVVHMLTIHLDQTIGEHTRLPSVGLSLSYRQSEELRINVPRLRTVCMCVS